MILRHQLFSICLAVTLYGVAGSGCVAQKLPEVLDTLTLTTDEEVANGLFLEAICQKWSASHRVNDTYFMLLQAIEKDSTLVGALMERSFIEETLGNDSLALSLLERAVQLDTANYYLADRLALSYLDAGREEECIAALEQLSARYPQKSELLLHLSYLYGRREDYEGVLRALERVELLEGKSEEVSMQKFQAYQRMGEEAKAFAEMQALAEEYPNDIRYQVLIGDLQFDAGRQEEAKATYDRLLQAHPGDVHVLLSLANYYTETGEDSLYNTVEEQLLLNESLQPAARLRYMQAKVYAALPDDADTTTVMALFRKLLAMPQEDTELAELCVRFMITKNAPREESDQVLQLMLHIDPENDLARNTLLARAIEDGDTDEIIRLCQTAVQYNSPNAIYYYYLALGHYNKDNYEEALETMERGLTKLDEQSSLSMIVNMYAICGDIYHLLGENERAFAAYDTCLLYRPNEAMVLNNYAYYLSLCKKDLERAEQMSLKSIEEVRKTGKESTTYLDTYAWILFQQKRYEEALVVMERVLALYGFIEMDGIAADPEEEPDPTVYEHAGDIYIQLSRTEEALRCWQEALKGYEDEATDTQERAEAVPRVNNKIKKKKFIEY